MNEVLPGKKTYILIGLALAGALATYVSGVISNGFDLNGLLAFVQSQAVVAAIATLRLALEKK